MYDVIILEDNIYERKELESIVKELDCSLRIFSTEYAQEALEIAERNDIKLFIFDIKLPDFSGMKLANYIRNIERYKLTPLVFITSVSDADLVAFKKLHCYDYIIKPFDLEYVSEILNNLIKYGINREEDSYFIIKKRSFTFRIKEKDIIYIERINRKIYFFMKDNSYTVSNMNLGDVLKELPSYFIQCHRSIIVNTRKIHHIDNKEKLIYLRDLDETIPLGDKYREQLGDSI